MMNDVNGRGRGRTRLAHACAPLLVAAAVSAQPGGLAESTGDLLWQKLEARVDAACQRVDGVMGAAILDLTDGRLLTRNAEHVFPTASTIKLPLLVELYRQDQQGRAGAAGVARLDDPYTFDPADLVEDSQIMAGLTPGRTRLTNRDLAQFMIAVSDNAATNVLYDRVGRDRVDAMLRALGLTHTKLRRKMIDLEAARRGDENVATPLELVRLLEAIYHERVLDHETTDAFLHQLSTGKSSQIPRLLPPGVRVANKPGSLDAVRTDSGIVYAANRPFAMSVMVSYAADGAAAERAIAEVALDAYRYFEMRGRTTEYGRGLPGAILPH